MAPSAATPQEWLRTFEAAVRARDFAVGRELFATDAMAFGTWARAVAGLDNIVREQWQNVWPRIRNFHFEGDTSVHASGDSARIAGGWLTEVTGPDGRPVTRPGRGTFVLERRSGKWLAVHSHFSLLPSQSETAHRLLPSDAARSCAPSRHARHPPPAAARSTTASARLAAGRASWAPAARACGRWPVSGPAPSSRPGRRRRSSRSPSWR